MASLFNHLFFCLFPVLLAFLYICVINLLILSVTFSRCITLNSVDPELSLSVVRILLQLSESSDVQNEIIVNLASKKVL